MRERDTPAQMDLPYDERRRNVRGAFRCTRALLGPSVAVVDDVMTTGETLNEIASRAQESRRRARGQLGRGAHLPGQLMFNIVLVHPEIPPNAGNVIRLAANTGSRLHLVEPLGFTLEDRQLQARRPRLPRHGARGSTPRLGSLPPGARRAAPVRASPRAARATMPKSSSASAMRSCSAPRPRACRRAARGVRAPTRVCGCRCSPATAASTSPTPSPSSCSKPGARSAFSVPASQNRVLTPSTPAQSATSCTPLTY